MNSSVNAPLPTVHWYNIVESDHGTTRATSLCGQPVLDEDRQLTEDCDVVSCTDCCWRLVAVLHKQQAQILATLMKSAARNNS